jgi:hypothetical protein
MKKRTKIDPAMRLQRVSLHATPCGVSLAGYPSPLMEKHRNSLKLLIEKRCDLRTENYELQTTTPGEQNATPLMNRTYR